MRKDIKIFFISILVIGLLTTSGFAKLGTNDGTTSGGTQKVIAVVLDDSTSMVRDDPGNKSEYYTTRWVEADYSIRALAAMMDSGDILRIYPLNGSAPFSVTIGEDDLGTALFNKLNSMGYYGATRFDQVQEAAKYLKGVQGKECCLVVITDGNFQSDNGTDMTQDELDKAFASALTSKIKAHYIQIGKIGSNSCLPSIPGISVHQDISNGITRQITDVINEIYHRVAMEREDKTALIMYPSEGSLTVGFNIPIKSATIFLQGNADWDSIQLSAEPYASDSTEIFSKQPNFPDLWKSPRETCNKEWIKTIQLSGLVINCSATNRGMMESITVSGVPSLDRDSIQVYYEPAVEQQITITQRDGLSFVYGQLDPPLFVEGPIEIAIDYQGPDGKALDLNTASMLRTEATTVEVNGRLLSGVRQEDGRYVYSGTLSAADAGSVITISNAIGMDGGERSIPIEEIYEPNMKLTLGLAQDPLELMLDKEGSTVLSVTINDEVAGAPPKLSSDMAPECVSEHFNADMSRFTYEDGILRIPLTLKNVEEHQIDPTERFTVKVSIPYSDSIRPPEQVEMIFPAVPVTSEPHELSVEPENVSTSLIYVLALGKTFPVTYSCDGQTLSKEQTGDADLSLTLADADLNGLITLDNGNIRLKAQALQWLNVRNKEYEAQLTFSYTKWNQPAQISVPITLSLGPITAGQIIALVIVLIALTALLYGLIRFVWWYFKGTKNDDYIDWNTTFELINRDDPTGRTQLSWSWYSKRLFRAKFWGKRYAHIRRRVSDEMDDGPLPIRIDLYVAREGEYWKLGEIYRRMRPTLDECDLRIGSVLVDHDNCRFLAGDAFENKLELKRPNYTHPWYLRITENE